MKLPKLFILLLLLPAMAAGQQEAEKKLKHQYNIVVSATLEETTTDKTGSSVTVITAEEIRSLQARTVIEVLQYVPGVEITTNGPLGGTASVFIRGAKSEHTLLMIDGVEMNDVISPARSYDFAHLTTENIERIEIIRGPQSVVHGSDAIGGVINIITRKGGEAVSGTVDLEGGSYGSYRGIASIRGGGESIAFSAAASRVESDGFSAADEELDGNSEKDGYENTSMSGRLTFKPEDKTSIDVTMRYLDATADIDNGGGAFADDPNSFLDTRQYSVRAQGKSLLLNNSLEVRAGISYSKTERENRNDTDEGNPFSSVDAEYSGDLIRFDVRTTWHASESLSIQAGIETEEETASSEYRSTSVFGPFTDIFAEQSARTSSVFVQGLMSNNGLNATAGFRHDDHEIFGGHTSFRATASMQLAGGAIIRGSIGTGFKAPSLFQLYSSFGSLELEQEESIGWDAGVEQTIADGALRVGAGWFYNEYTNLIDFSNLTFSYSNIAEASSQGLELFARIKLADWAEALVNYTYTDAKDETTDEQLLRRAKHRINARLDIEAGKNLEGFVAIRYSGPRQDVTFQGFSSVNVELEAFTLVHAGLTAEVTETISIFGRLENIFDEDYEYVFGYDTPGFSGYVGGRIAF